MRYNELSVSELYAEVKKLNYRRYRPMYCIAELAECSRVWVWKVFTEQATDDAVIAAARRVLEKAKEEQAKKLSSVI